MDKNLKRIKYLEEQILYHQDLYYNKQPEISDEDFDKLWDELHELNPDNALFQKVGEDLSTGFKKAEHLIPMGSQEKAANPSAFYTWANKMPFSTFIVQYKLDGASLELQYKNGKFVKGVTRGNGSVGDDITENVKKMQGLIFELKENGKLVDFTGGIRGEVIMKRSIHSAYYSDKANCRNACNGVMKRKDGKGSEHLTIICYDALETSNSLFSSLFTTELEKLAWLERVGFTTVEKHVCHSSEEVVDYRAQVMEKRSTLDYDIDGLVIKGNEIDTKDTARPRPEKQIAFKFSLEEAVSTLLSVEWSESGATYTPIALISPVYLQGTTVKRASLANPGIIKALNLKIGSKVLVTKRGEIIPKIETVVSSPIDAKPIPFPSICSSCGAPLVNEETRLYCPNPKCKKLQFHRLEKWVSVLDIQDLGITLLTKLFDIKRVQNIVDLYTLSWEELSKLDRLGEILAKKIVRSIKSKTNVSLASFIAGFDIEGIGQVMAEKLVGAGYNTLEKLFKASKLEIAKIPNFGEILAHNFVTGLVSVKDEMLELVNNNYIVIKDASSLSTSKIANLSFCFTGELKTMKRQEAENLVRQNGGFAKSSVTKDLNFLVTNDLESSSSKTKKARELGIKMIDETEFLHLLSSS